MRSRARSSPCSAQRAATVGKRRAHRVGVEVAQVEGDVGAERGRVAGDRPRDDVAGAELGHRVLVGHEAAAGGVAQDRRPRRGPPRSRGRAGPRRGPARWGGTAPARGRPAPRPPARRARGRRRWRRAGWWCASRAGPCRRRRARQRGPRGRGSAPVGVLACAARRRGRRATITSRARSPSASSMRGSRRSAALSAPTMCAPGGVARRRGRPARPSARPRARAAARPSPAVEIDPAGEQRGHLAGPLAADAGHGLDRRRGRRRPRACRATCASTESWPSIAAAMPPWARRVLPSPSASLVTTTTGPVSAAVECEEAPGDAAPHHDDGVELRAEAISCSFDAKACAELTSRRQ